jgi:site-specific recombinase XerD
MRMLRTPYDSDSSKPRLLAAEKAVTSYLESLSPGSQRTVAQSLDMVAIALLDDKEADRFGVPWHQLDRVAIEQARTNLANTYEPATVNKMLSCIRGVLRNCHKLQQISTKNFDAVMGFANVPMVYHPDAQQLPLVSDDDVTALLDSCFCDTSPAGRRDAALLAILLSSGLRRAEAAAMQLDDYNLAKQSLRVTTGERSRTLMLKPDAAALIEAWLNVREYESGPLLLPVNKSGIIVHRQLTDQAIYDIIRRLAVRAGVPHITTRALRRTLVASLIAHGLPLQRVQEIIGHASWITTEAYSQLAHTIAAHGSTPLSQFLPPDPRSCPKRCHQSDL